MQGLDAYDKRCPKTDHFGQERIMKNGKGKGYFPFFNMRSCNWTLTCGTQELTIDTFLIFSRS